ncbi:MAG TPA: type VI secretion system tip protein TssI/VgrG, partial [Chloroflexia bacterium]|nr:type VI secretion system tip protein TssI/VgrG [Chloroflexia bacterium]
MPTYTQTNVYLSVSTPLGQDKLLLVEVHGEERISGLFRYTLKMLSEDKNLSFDNIVGKSATIALGMVSGDKRYVNGVVARFYQAGSDGVFTTYYAEIHPWLWLLTLTSDSRIFQQMSAPDIVAAVFKSLGFADYKLALSKSYLPREYCVQYQETAFNFVSRLMEDEGICYFFEHAEGKHTLVLADDASAYAPCPGLPGQVRYQSALPGSTQADAITGCTFERQVTTDGYSMGDFNFEAPTNSLLGNAQDGGKLGMYEYPGRFSKQDVGNQKAKVRLESREAPRTLLRGEAFTPAFNPGHTFTLVGHDRDEVNTTYV